MRDLKHDHEGFPRVHAWPPVWLPGSRIAEGEFGAEVRLVSVKRSKAIRDLGELDV